MPMRRLLILIGLLVLVGCSTTPRQEEALSPSMRAYLDANLGLTISIPADWNRKSIVPPETSSASYSVLWSAPQKLAGVSLQVSALTAGDLTATASQAIAAFTRTHPGFTLIARSLDQIGPWEAETALGHTSRRNFRLVHIAADRHVFQIVFAAPPENFQRLDSLFSDIIASFQPLE